MKRGLMLALVLGAAALAPVADSAPPAYAPGLGDFMTAYVQPHHIKLWFAGKAGNWPLAAYEAKELGESFEDITTYQADWDNVPVGQFVKSMIEPALGQVESAIKAKSAARFKSAYTTMTAACNACHAAAKMPIISVKIPSRNPFSDQNFAAH